MDNELRFGEIRFDQWFLHAKIMDLPTIVEALKTIDTKSFYKTADICQMVCFKLYLSFNKSVTDEFFIFKDDMQV